MGFALKKKFLTEPKQMLKFVVLLGCVVFTIYQVCSKSHFMNLLPHSFNLIVKT